MGLWNSIWGAEVAGLVNIVEDLSPQLGGNLDLNGFTITGLAIGVDVQAWDAQLDTWATVTPSANGQSLVAAATYAAMRTLLDLEPGTDFYDIAAADAAFQPLDAGLTDLAVLAVTDGNFIVGDGLNWVAEAPATARTSLGLGTGDSPQFTGIELGHATDTTLVRVSAGVVSIEGSNILLASGLGSITQAWDAELLALAGLTSAADKVPYFTGSGTAAVADLTAAARTVLDDASVAAMRTTLELVGAQSVYIPAAAFMPTITNGASRYVAEDGTNDLMQDSLGFDQTTQEFATIDWTPPLKYDGGTLTFIPEWRPGAAGGAAETVDWGLSAVFIRNDDAADAAPGTVVVVTDTWIAATDLHIGPVSGAVTPAGTYAAGCKLRIKIQRNVAGDDLADDARLQGLTLFFTTDQALDT